MIKVINFGTNTPDNRLNIIQRNGKRIALALTIEIDTISDLLRLDAETTVKFGIEEVPEKAALKVITDTAEGEQALLVIEYNKPVKDDVRATIAEFVGKCLKSVAV